MNCAACLPQHQEQRASSTSASSRMRTKLLHNSSSSSRRQVESRSLKKDSPQKKYPHLWIYQVMLRGCDSLQLKKTTKLVNSRPIFLLYSPSAAFTALSRTNGSAQGESAPIAQFTDNRTSPSAPPASTLRVRVFCVGSSRQTVAHLCSHKALPTGH